MKQSYIITISLSCLLIIGCQEDLRSPVDERLINTELVRSFHDVAWQNAIISQHTLFPYHFVDNGAELNELGGRDLGVLVSHFKENPGPLNVRHDGIPDDIYQARVDLVVDRLNQAGIEIERVSVSDGTVGGSGIASERILILLEKPYESTPAKTTTQYTSTGAQE
jgi:hypothetical protein